jgi:hypothetical protein
MPDSIETERDSPNINIFLMSVLTPVSKSRVLSNFSAKEQNVAC